MSVLDVEMKVFINITKMYLFYTAKYQMFSIPNECGFTCDYTIRNGKFGVVE